MQRGKRGHHRPGSGSGGHSKLSLDLRFKNLYFPEVAMISETPPVVLQLSVRLLYTTRLPPQIKRESERESGI